MAKQKTIDQIYHESKPIIDKIELMEADLSKSNPLQRDILRAMVCENRQKLYDIGYYPQRLIDVVLNSRRDRLASADMIAEIIVKDGSYITCTMQGNWADTHEEVIAAENALRKMVKEIYNTPPVVKEKTHTERIVQLV